MSTILDVLRKAESDGRGGRRGRTTIEPPRGPLGPKKPRRRLALILAGVAVLAAAFAAGLTLSNRDEDREATATKEQPERIADAGESASEGVGEAAESAVDEGRHPAPLPAGGEVSVGGRHPAPNSAAVPPSRPEQGTAPSKPPRKRANREDAEGRGAAIAARMERLQERRRDRQDHLASARGTEPRSLAARAERPGPAGAGTASNGRPPEALAAAAAVASMTPGRHAAPAPAPAAPGAPAAAVQAPAPHAPAAPAPLAAPPPLTAQPPPVPPEEQAVLAAESGPPGSPEPPSDQIAAATRQPPSGAPNVAINIVQWSASADRRFAFVSVDGGGMTQVREGDEISGLTVKRIYQEMIEFAHDGSSFLMRAN